MSREMQIQSLELLKAGGLRPGPDMERAHEICQAHEGIEEFDWIHALIHRIEGDAQNAAYWYRRAGKERHPGSVAEEWDIIWREAQ
ncbi:MAG: hypothetical protein JXR14_09645 [Paracoccaceae bacterium]